MKAIGNFLAALCGLGILAFAGVKALAQEQAAAGAAGELIRLAQDEAATSDDEEAEEEQEAKEEEQEPPSRSTTPQKFIPTEKISADSAVSFPVDI